MSRALAVSSLEKQIASSAWKAATSLPIYPETYRGTIEQKDHLRFYVIVPNSTRVGYGPGNSKLTGEVIIQYYSLKTVPEPTRLGVVDKMLAFWQDRLFENNLQTFQGYITRLGSDPADKAFSRLDLHVPFTYYGV